MFTPPPTTIRVLEYHENFNYLKAHPFLLLLVIFSLSFKYLFCQNPLSSPPPIDWAAVPAIITNQDNFRGMYVSKADILIKEIKDPLFGNGAYDDIGNNTPKTKELFRYATENFFTYIAIYSLAKENENASDPDPLIGNSQYAAAIRTFLSAAHAKGIKVGFVVVGVDAMNGNNTPAGSATAYKNFITSDFYYDFSTDLFPNCQYDANIGANSTSKTLSFGNGNEPDSSKVNPITKDYLNVNRSEMIKQALRLLQYSYETKDWWSGNSFKAKDLIGEEKIKKGTNGQTFQSLKSSSNLTAPLADYLFDYISLEYEFWDGGEYTKFTAINGVITKERIAWNTFTDVSEAILFVYKKMCSYIHTELEFKLVPQLPDLGIPSYDPAEGIFDPNWGQSPPTEMQVAYLTKYYNRILLSSYKNGTIGGVSDMISKTDDVLTLFAQNPGTVGSNKNLLVPLFSAEAALDERHDLGDQSAYTQAPPCAPCSITVTTQSFLGELLKLSTPLAGLPWSHPVFSSPSADWEGWGDNPYLGNTLAYFEHEYMIQMHESFILGRPPCNCASYAIPSVPCTYNIANNRIAGYMWFKYEFLNNPFRVPNEHHRIMNKKQIIADSTFEVSYTISNSELSIKDFSNTSNIETTEIIIFDISGKQVLLTKLQKENNVISLNNYAAGTYFYNIRGKSKEKRGKVIVIK